MNSFLNKTVIIGVIIIIPFLIVSSSVYFYANSQVQQLDTEMQMKSVILKITDIEYHSCKFSFRHGFYLVYSSKFGISNKYKRDRRGRRVWTNRNLYVAWTPFKYYETNIHLIDGNPDRILKKPRKIVSRILTHAKNRSTP